MPFAVFLVFMARKWLTIMGKKGELKKDYSGLSVNERLMVSGLLERFDAAVRARNRQGMLSMLKRVSLTETYANQWVDALLGDQTFFYR